MNDYELFIRNLPEHERDSVAPKKRAPFPVCRVSVPWKGGKSWHLISALKAFLARPAVLPRDPGPGDFAIAARLDPAVIVKAMRLSGERSRAALVRRVLAAKYFSRPAVASVKPAVKPSPAAKPAPVAKPCDPHPKNLSDSEYVRRLHASDKPFKGEPIV